MRKRLAPALGALMLLLSQLSTQAQDLPVPAVITCIQQKDLMKLVNEITQKWKKASNPSPVAGPTKETSFDKSAGTSLEGTNYLAAEDNKLVGIRTASITKFKNGNVQMIYSGVQDAEMDSIRKYLAANGFRKSNEGSGETWKSATVTVVFDTEEDETGEVSTISFYRTAK